MQHQDGPSVGCCLLLTGALAERRWGFQRLEAEVAQIVLSTPPGLGSLGLASATRGVQLGLANKRKEGAGTRWAEGSSSFHRRGPQELLMDSAEGKARPPHPSGRVASGFLFPGSIPSPHLELGQK